MPWYNSSWERRKKLTIDYTKVSGDLTDFPVLISLASDAQLAANARSDGFDILFTQSDAVTKINYERAYYNNSTGQLICWVKVPAVSSAIDTEIFMYYDNPSASDQQNKIGTWDSQYMGVWHLDEASGNALDSTSYNLSGTLSGGVTQNSTGKIHKAYNFVRSTTGTVNMGDPVDGHLDCGDENDFTISFWIDLVYFYFWDCPVVSKKAGPNTSQGGYNVYMNNDSVGIPRYVVSDYNDWYGVSGGLGVLGQGWKYVVAVFDQSSSATSTIYHDGVDDKDGQGGVIGNVGSLANPLNFRLNGYSSPWFESMLTMGLDEVRVSKIIRDGNWIATEYANQDSPSTFYSLGSQERIGYHGRIGRGIMRGVIA